MPDRLVGYDRLLAHVKGTLQSTEAPQLVGIAGPPGSGKSSLAERMVSDLAAPGHPACLCPMDGFHLINAQLQAAGIRDAKGRIDTFDAAAFAAAVARLRAREPFWWPRYSRQRHDPIAEGTRIDGTEAVYVIEGNYILTDTGPWRTAAREFDLRIFVDAPDHILRERLLHRHQRSGRSKQQALAKIERTDMPNAQAIRETRHHADILFIEATDE